MVGSYVERDNRRKARYGREGTHLDSKNTYRMCRSKKKLTKEAANRIIKRRMLEGCPYPLYPYTCPLCGWVHLTKEPR